MGRIMVHLYVLSTALGSSISDTHHISSILLAALDEVMLKEGRGGLQVALLASSQDMDCQYPRTPDMKSAITTPQKNMKATNRGPLHLGLRQRDSPVYDFWPRFGQGPQARSRQGL